jgi:hypothetical protein
MTIQVKKQKKKEEEDNGEKPFAKRVIKNQKESALVGELNELKEMMKT